MSKCKKCGDQEVTWTKNEKGQWVLLQNEPKPGQEPRHKCPRSDRREYRRALAQFYS